MAGGYRFWAARDPRIDAVYLYLVRYDGERAVTAVRMTKNGPKWSDSLDESGSIPPFAVIPGREWDTNHEFALPEE